MERLTLLILFLIYDIKGSSTQSLPCLTASGDNCTSSVCPNTVVTYTCTITNGTAAGFTDWTLPSGACPSSSFRDKIRLSQLVGGLCVPQGNSTCGPYTASSGPASDATYCLSSILTVNITAAMNGGTVTCFNTNLFNTAITTVVSLATISVVGAPGAPNAMAETIGPDMVLVEVNPSSSGGLPTNYSFTISNSSGYVSTKSISAFPNGSAMVTFTGVGLTNNTNYTISAVAINCAGSSISSNITTILVSWPAPTPSLPTSSGTKTPLPTTTTLPLTKDPDIPIIIGVVIAVVVLVVLIVISIVICVFLCKPSNGSKLNKIDGQDDQPLAQVKVELLEELVPARPPRQVLAEESHGKTQANRVPIEEALYDGNVGPGGMVTTGRGGYTQEAQYSTPDVSKKNADKQMYAEVQVSTAPPKNTASSSKKGKGVLPPPSTQEGVFYSTVKI